MASALHGARVLVTGASAGIGAELARRFAREGATMGLVARREGRLASVLAECQQYAPGSRMWVQDLGHLDDLAGFAQMADDELGGIDILVNNAGMPKRRSVLALTDAEIDDAMALNYLSPVRLTRAVLPAMLERGRGRVVFVSSVAARFSPPGEAAYAATKAAMTAFAESLAVETWDTPVGVHVVYPGVIDTELFDLPGNDPLLADVERLPASAVGDAVVAMLADGAFEAWIPGWMADVAKGKADDIEGFLAGSAAYAKEQS